MNKFMDTIVRVDAAITKIVRWSQRDKNLIPTEMIVVLSPRHSLSYARRARGWAFAITDQDDPEKQATLIENCSFRLKVEALKVIPGMIADIYAASNAYIDVAAHVLDAMVLPPPVEET